MSSPAQPSGRLTAFSVQLVLVAGILAIMFAALMALPLRTYGELEGALKIDSAQLCGIASGMAKGIGLSCENVGEIALPALLPVTGEHAVSSAKFRVEFPGTSPNALQALMVPRQWDNLQVAINGIWITPQRDKGRLWHDWNRPTYLPLAAPLLSRERNTLEIVVSGKGSPRLALYPFYVGDPDRLRLSWLSYLTLRTGIVRTNGALAILLGLTFLIFWRSLPPSMGAGWLVAMMAATALYSFHWSYPNMVPEAGWWEMLIVLSTPFAVYCTHRFLHAFLDGPPVHRLQISEGLFALCVLIYMVGMVQDSDLAVWTYLCTGAMAVHLMVSLLNKSINKTPRLQAILFGLIGMATACSFVGWLQSYTSVAAELPDLLVLAPVLLHMAVGWTLLERLIQLKREREAANLRLEQELARKSSELERIYGELSAQQKRQAISEERQRIMLDLHDGVGGQLVNTLAYIETAYGDDAVLQNAIEDALREMGMMVDSLNSQNDIATMLGTLRNRIEPLLERHHAQFSWNIEQSPQLPEQNPSRVTALMRIVQEAITNAVKHSGAALIRVEADTNTIRIHDNGEGFEPSSARSLDTSGGIGIAGMRRRANDLAIDFSLVSSPTGTSIELKW